MSAPAGPTATALVPTVPPVDVGAGDGDARAVADDLAAQLSTTRGHLLTAMSQLSLMQQAIESKLLRKGVSRSLASLSSRDKSRRAAAEQVMQRNKEVLFALTHAVAGSTGPIDASNLDAPIELIASLTAPAGRSSHARPFSLASLTSSISGFAGALVSASGVLSSSAPAIAGNAFNVAGDVATIESDDDDDDIAISRGPATVYDRFLCDSSGSACPTFRRTSQLYRRFTGHSRASVLLQPDLLARVLSFLPHRDIAHSAAVCALWRTMPLRSDMLLFLMMSSGNGSGGAPGSRPDSHTCLPDSIRCEAWRGVFMTSTAPLPVRLRGDDSLALGVTTRSNYLQPLLLRLAGLFAFPAIQRWAGKPSLAGSNTPSRVPRPVPDGAALTTSISPRLSRGAPSTSFYRSSTLPAVGPCATSVKAAGQGVRTRQRNRPITRVYKDSESDSDDSESRVSLESGVENSKCSSVSEFDTASGFCDSATVAIPCVARRADDVPTPAAPRFDLPLTSRIGWIPSRRLHGRTLLKLIIFFSDTEAWQRSSNTQNSTPATLTAPTSHNVGRVDIDVLRDASGIRASNHTLRLSALPALTATSFLPQSSTEVLVASAAESTWEAVPASASLRSSSDSSSFSDFVVSAISASSQPVAPPSCLFSPGSGTFVESAWQILQPAVKESRRLTHSISEPTIDQLDTTSRFVPAMSVHTTTDEIFNAFASVGASLRLSSELTSLCQATATAVRKARAAVNSTLTTIKAAAEDDTPLDADVSVKFASACEAVMAKEQMLQDQLASACSAIRVSHAICFSADRLLVAGMLSSWQSWLSDIAAAWIWKMIRTASTAASPMEPGLSQYFPHPATGKVICTDGFTIPATAASIREVLEWREVLSRGFRDDIADVASSESASSSTSTPAPPFTQHGNRVSHSSPGFSRHGIGNLPSRQSRGSDIVAREGCLPHPLLCLPPRLMDMLIAEAQRDVCVEEEDFLGLRGVSVEIISNCNTSMHKPGAGAIIGDPIKLSLGVPADGVTIPVPEASAAELGGLVSVHGINYLPWACSAPSSLSDSDSYNAALGAASAAASKHNSEQLSTQVHEAAIVAAATAAASAANGGLIDNLDNCGPPPTRPDWTAVFLPGLPANMPHTLIDADVRRTFGELDAHLRRGSSDTLAELLPTTFFDPDMPSLNASHVAILRYRLRHVLMAYAAFDRDCGYCQGINFLVSVLLLHTTHASDAFWGLSAFIYNPVFRFGEIFSPGLPRVASSFHVVTTLLGHHLPRLARHLSAERVLPDMYAAGWVMTLFSSQETLPLKYVVAVWDSFLLGDGWATVYRAILALFECVSTDLQIADFPTIVQFLHKFPLNRLPSSPQAFIHHALRFDVSHTVLRKLEYKFLSSTGQLPVPGNIILPEMFDTVEPAVIAAPLVCDHFALPSDDRMTPVVAAPLLLESSNLATIPFTLQTTAPAESRSSPCVNAESDADSDVDVPDLMVDLSSSAVPGTHRPLAPTDSPSPPLQVPIQATAAVSTPIAAPSFAISSLPKKPSASKTVRKKAKSDPSDAVVFDDGGVASAASALFNANPPNESSRRHSMSEDTSGAAPCGEMVPSKVGLPLPDPSTRSSDSFDDFTLQHLHEHPPAASLIGNGIPASNAPNTSKSLLSPVVVPHRSGVPMAGPSRALASGEASSGVKGRLTSSSAGAPVAPSFMASVVYGTDPLAGGRTPAISTAHLVEDSSIVEPRRQRIALESEGADVHAVARLQHHADSEGLDSVVSDAIFAAEEVADDAPSKQNLKAHGGGFLSRLAGARGRSVRSGEAEVHSHRSHSLPAADHHHHIAAPPVHGDHPGGHCGEAGHDAFLDL